MTAKKTLGDGPIRVPPTGRRSSKDAGRYHHRWGRVRCSRPQDRRGWSARTKTNSHATKTAAEKEEGAATVDQAPLPPATKVDGDINTGDAETEHLGKSGPLLWNLVYDGILRIRVPGVRLIAYADDLAVLVSSYSYEGIGRNLASALRKVKCWLDRRGLTLAAEKTEIIQISGPNCPGVSSLCILGHDLRLARGSVLGPLLWDLAYDVVLRTALPLGVSVTCYADDTLVLASGRGWRRVVRLAEMGVACAVSCIRRLGLEVSASKTEALWFNEPRRAEPPRSWVRVGEGYVRVGPTIKYLGLTLDSHWRFQRHFETLVPRVERAANSLARLLPNLGGPGVLVRRLYTGVVRSMVMYGSPIWAQDLVASRRSCNMLRRLERRMAIRCIRSYRTTAYAAAMTLAGLIPLELQAEESAAVYDRVKALQRGELPPSEVATWSRLAKRQARRRALAKWRARLEEPANARQRAVGAVLPSLGKWMGGVRGGLTYRVAQVLTGHGCFGEYLHRIGKEETAQCHHCGEEQDTPQHTLEECPAWSAERRALRGVVGVDLSPPVLVEAMLEGRDKWSAVASFCEQVMLQKEAAERDRERSDPARRATARGRMLRRRRGGANTRPP
ncbi:Putative 115 kDa protein in type-1 retrotransposable element R1DM [Anthophora plagiata]